MSGFYARIDEAKVTTTGRGAHWLANQTLWFHHMGMLTTVGAGLTGGTVYLRCHSRERAEELVEVAVSHGVPANCAKVVDCIPATKAVAS